MSRIDFVDLKGLFCQSKMSSYDPDGIGLHTGGGWSFDIQGEKTFITGNYVWYTPYGRNYWRLRTVSGMYNDFRPTRINVTLADEIPKAPQGNQSDDDWMVQFQINGSSDWYQGRRSATTRYLDNWAEEFTVNRIKHTLKDPASYPVAVRSSTSIGGGQPGYTQYCFIDIGERSCIVNRVISINKENYVNGYGQLSSQMFVDRANDNQTSNDNTFGWMSQGYTTLAFDFNKPTLEDIIISDNQTITATFRAPTEHALTGGDSWRYGYKTRKAFGINESGKKTELKVIEKNDINIWTSRQTFDFSVLPTGVYKLLLEGEDKFGRVVTHESTGIIVDKDAPIITILNNGIELKDGHLIVGLESLTISLSDPSAPDVKSVLLRGGPASDQVYLATRKVAEDRWELEYPRIFPALNPGEEYTLTVEATDRFSNVSEKTVSFLYQPTDLVDFGRLDLLAVDQALYLPDDKPINVLITDPIRTNAGHLARGKQESFVTVRSDADMPVLVEGHRIEPGQTVQLLLEADASGRLVIPVYPAERGSGGEVDIMIEVPVITTDLH